jgi:CubicO group peptidase (beta-lactamase class C family)
MKKLLGILVLGLIICNITYAKKNTNTWDYPFLAFDKFETKGSQDFYKFQSNLKKDKDVLKEFKNNKKTGIISYLLFEDGKIVIDESDIPITVQGDRIINGLLPSHSMGKSLVSYVTGHAICEGYISSVDERLTGWDVINNTLYEDQVLIDLLNMTAGDQEYIGERLVGEDNFLKKSKVNGNLIPLRRIMELDLRNSKKSKPVYNYSALTTHVILNYVIHKTENDWEKLLHKVFNEHVKVKNSVYFVKTPKVGRYEELIGYEQSGRYSFYATRYDYLRIAKTMMDDWHNDTCAGKYLKTIYKNRIKKKDNTKEPDDVGLYTKTYGGQFHFDIFGLKKTRKIIGMSGFAGQQILIDLDNKRIIVVNSLYKNYNWKKIVHSVIKKGK